MLRDRREYEITTKTGKVIGLYRQTGSMYNFRVTVNGHSIKEFKTLGDANRCYNETIVKIG